MKNQIVFVAGLLLASTVASADGFNTSWDEGWRLTVGPQFNFNAKGRLGVKGAAMPLSSSSSRSTRAAAKAAGDGISIGADRIDLGNGAFIDPNDAAGNAGETWNWRLPAGRMDLGSLSVVSPYVEESTVYSISGGMYDKDEANSTGVNFGIDRTVFAWGDFGVDVGFNFSFFINNNWFKGHSGAYTRTDTSTSGSYITDVNLGNVDVLTDPWSHNPDGSYGAGTYDGPGPVLDLGEVTVGHRWDAEQTSSETTSYGPFSIRGDLQMYEFQLALKPYYELTDWFMLRSTLGVGLDYRNFDVRVSGLGGESERDWDCYMICGLGGMLHWEGVCLGVDFLRKVFDDEMDVKTRYVNGSIGNASWILRAYVGYEF